MSNLQTFNVLIGYHICSKWKIWKRRMIFKINVKCTYNVCIFPWKNTPSFLKIKWKNINFIFTFWLFQKRLIWVLCRSKCYPGKYCIIFIYVFFIVLLFKIILLQIRHNLAFCVLCCIFLCILLYFFLHHKSNSKCHTVLDNKIYSI